MFRQWKLLTLIATVIIYIIGILILSLVNLQATSQQKRFRTSRFVSDSNAHIHHNSETSLLRRNPVQQLQWCTELKFMDQKPTDRTHSSIKQQNHQTFLDSDRNEFTNGKSEKSDQVYALASFPGSGNTWLRYLLQQATGYLTGSVYKDYGLLRSGFPAESISNKSVLIVKTHEFGFATTEKFKKAVLLVRDPAKSIIAEFNRQSGGHVGHASIDRYKRTNGRYWLKFVTNKLNTWVETNMFWGRNFTGDVLIIWYEDLVDNVENTLRNILNFIEFPIDEDLLACALKRKEGIYRRKKRLLNFDPYTASMKKMIEKKRIYVYKELGRYKSNVNL
ncbi:hypothetical protein PVAND_011806 [Polypedilum vanderplanki]|uniref:Uncharacterized protein n=1 Tax=Polypedilum vanderplanki TaxID=319348 RepID=A0A9J6CKR9_POLVA|nr:hypothetical protein PVAND_011806 [Polypedilum vanderplanki]